MRTVTSEIIPCRLFVSSHLLFNPLAASAGKLSQMDSSTKRRGSKALSPGSRGEPEAGELCWVCPGSLQASSILLQCRWQPGTATGAVGERENPNPWAHALQISQLHLPGKKNTARCLRLLTAWRPCWSLGHSDIWEGSGFKKPRYSPSLLCSAEGFPWANNS